MVTELREGQPQLLGSEPNQTVDLLIVGGGINGVGIARDAAGRGLSVVLCEKDDLASGTSSASSKLIHGGLRYLEYYEFGLVRKALREREILLALAPHISWPLSFVVPHNRSLRPAWLIQLGLWIYDNLARRARLSKSRRLDLKTTPEGAPLRPEYETGFVYADAWVDDSRLVILNAMDARDRGASIRTRAELVGAECIDGCWHSVLRDVRTGQDSVVVSRALVNATGPWVGQLADRLAPDNGSKQVRLVKGSHIVVPRLYQGDHAYLLQSPDRRIVFVLPFEDDFSLIGTTDIPFSGGPVPAPIDRDEIDYLCASVNRYFAVEIDTHDVVWSFSGLRPLVDDGAADPSAVTRDYQLNIQTGTGAPLLTVLGGKITTFRRLAEEALDVLSPHFPHMLPRWTENSFLPGGATVNFRARWPWLPDQLCQRFARHYGAEMENVIGDATSMDDLGPDLGAGLYAREVAYLVEHEWAQSAEDILWRRTKLGLRMSKAQIHHLEMWLSQENRDISHTATAQP